MSSNRSCVVKEFPLPDREYRVAPARCWDADLVSPAPSRRIKRRRRSLLPLLLLGLVLFGGGFLLGRAALAKELPAQACGTPVSILAPEGGGRTDGQMPELPAGQENPDWTALGQEPVLSVSPEDWSLILVNWENPLPEDFSIPRLTQLANGHAIDSRAYPEAPPVGGRAPPRTTFVSGRRPGGGTPAHHLLFVPHPGEAGGAVPKQGPTASGGGVRPD